MRIWEVECRTHKARGVVCQGPEKEACVVEKHTEAGGAAARREGQVVW